MIYRTLSSIIEKRLNAKKTIIILGPRQSGKTWFTKELALKSDPSFDYWNCEDKITLERISNITVEQLQGIIGDKKAIFIDEIQLLPNSKNLLVLLKDQIKDTQLFLAGSYSLDWPDVFYNSIIGTIEYTLYPLSWEEFEAHSGITESKRQLETRVIYGMFPEVVSNPGHEIEILQKLIVRNIYKDILHVTKLRKPAFLEKLLQSLALQIGNEVTLNELSDLVRVDKNTINKYIGLLESSFIIFELRTLHRNLPHEINTGRKIYFFDNGIRNAVISSFSPMNLRQDSTALWENFCLSERQKFIDYRQRKAGKYFWRTTSKKKVDYVEEYEGYLHAYGFKWNRNSNKTFSKTFLRLYPGVSCDMITPSNFTKFLTTAKVKSL
jgi:uncharacterized protein